ncbi:MAG: IS1380 family transposase [Sporichthyaceae bacterium]
MKSNAPGSRVGFSAGSESLISSSGAVLLLRTAALSGLDSGLSTALRAWRPGGAVHDPGKTVLDLAVAIALGGDCLADVALVRAQPGLFGLVASDPTVCRLLDRLGADPDAAVAAIRTARAAARERVWARRCPVPEDGHVAVDIDASLIGAHSEKEHAAPTYKRGFGFHPMLAFVDHPDGTGEPLAAMLRPGNAGANDAADQITVLDAALAQLPESVRDRVLVRGDSAAGVKEFLAHVHGLGLRFSVGMGIRGPILAALDRVPEQAWRAAYDADGQHRPGAQVAELTAWLPESFTGWPPGTRMIARREEPHPGAQLRITDHNGWRLTAFATNTARREGWTLAELEVRHRLHARVEGRIRAAKDTGLTNLPLHAFDRNRLWLEIVQLAHELTVWTQVLGLHDQPARSWEPKRLRLRLFAVAGRILTSGRRTTLRISERWPWADQLTGAHAALAAYP